MKFFPAVCLFLVVGLGGISSAAAQPHDWGDIPREHLEMTAYADDPDAQAVILFDVGETRMRFNGEIEYQRHRRVKILSEGAYDFGKISVTYYAEDRYERVVGIDASTYVLDASGEVQRYELDGDDIFEEDVDGEWERKRFTLPNLQPGAVIEYRYKVRSKNPVYLRSWSFQTTEPTLYSKYEFEAPNFLQYVLVSKGRLAFDEKKSDHSRSALGDAMTHLWVMKDVPALREEPYMTTLDDHFATIEFQLSAISIPGRVYKKFMPNWKELADDLMSNRDFGRKLGDYGDVKDRARALTEGLTDDAAKMQAIYDFVRSSISWNGEYGIYLSQDLDEVLAARRGSAPDINLLLVSMLRVAGLDAYPMLISTRKHGRPLPLYPLVSQFNYVLGSVIVGDKVVLLDGTDPLRSAGHLPERALNQQGWVVREDNPAWIKIPVVVAHERQTFISGTLQPDGSLEGSVRVTDEGYSALGRRRILKDKPENQFVIQTILSDMGDVSPGEYTIEAKQATDKPLQTSVGFTTSAAGQALGEFIYFNPVLLDRREENPLRKPTRLFPVDFAYPRTHTYTLSVELPEGYTAAEIPGNVQVALPNKGAMFTRLAQVENGRLMVRMQYIVKQTRFEPGEYGALREFFDRVVSAQAEQVVLKRTDGSAPTEAGGTEAGGK